MGRKMYVQVWLLLIATAAAPVGNRSSTAIAPDVTHRPSRRHDWLATMLPQLSLAVEPKCVDYRYGSYLVIPEFD